MQKKKYMHVPHTASGTLLGFHTCQHTEVRKVDQANLGLVYAVPNIGTIRMVSFYTFSMLHGRFYRS